MAKRKNRTCRPHTGLKPVQHLIQDTRIPLVISSETKLSPELRQKLSKVAELTQQNGIAWANYRLALKKLRRLSAGLREQRDHLIEIDGWLHRAAESIRRELNLEGGDNQ